MPAMLAVLLSARRRPPDFDALRLWKTRGFKAIAYMKLYTIDRCERSYRLQLRSRLQRVANLRCRRRRSYPAATMLPNPASLLATVLTRPVAYDTTEASAASDGSSDVIASLR